MKDYLRATFLRLPLAVLGGAFVTTIVAVTGMFLMAPDDEASGFILLGTPIAFVVLAGLTGGAALLGWLLATLIAPFRHPAVWTLVGVGAGLLWVWSDPSPAFVALAGLCGGIAGLVTRLLAGTPPPLRPLS